MAGSVQEKLSTTPFWFLRQNCRNLDFGLSGKQFFLLNLNWCNRKKYISETNPFSKESGNEDLMNELKA